eukprot:TRINITY_DN5230_c0_g5_i1.p1 TRINITY_DN5230_c0_g5~~TRINITY_DN5230_c0_g5_i1.p1  ORF type:complete len:886 (+),score=246.54 TRINITY_DN5230_c0_g5_i1:115-2772(+)
MNAASATDTTGPPRVTRQRMQRTHTTRSRTGEHVPAGVGTRGRRTGTALNGGPLRSVETHSHPLPGHRPPPDTHSHPPPGQRSAPETPSQGRRESRSRRSRSISVQHRRSPAVTPASGGRARTPGVRAAPRADASHTDASDRLARSHGDAEVRVPSPAASRRGSRQQSPASRHRPPSPSVHPSSAAIRAGSRVRLVRSMAKAAPLGSKGTVVTGSDGKTVEVRLDGGGTMKLSQGLFEVLEDDRRVSRAPSARRRAASPATAGAILTRSMSSGSSRRITPTTPPQSTGRRAGSATRVVRTPQPRPSEPTPQTTGPVPRLVSMPGVAPHRRPSAPLRGRPRRSVQLAADDSSARKPEEPKRAGSDVQRKYQRSSTHSHPPSASLRDDTPQRRHKTPSSPAQAPSPTAARFSRSATHSAAGSGEADGKADRPEKSRERGASPAAKQRADRSAASPAAKQRAERPAASPAKLAERALPEIDPVLAADPRYQEDGYLPAACGAMMRRRYELLCELGAGQSATVWLARDVRREADDHYSFVAIKVTRCSSHVRMSSLHEVSLIDWIMRNSLVRARGDDTGSALLLDYFEHQGPHGLHVCMVFEVLGPTLDVLMENYSFRGVSDMSLVKGIIVSILRALDELSQMNVVHTDLKPENILFATPALAVRRVIWSVQHPGAAPDEVRRALPDTEPTDPHVKISDFGLSYLLQPEDGCLPDGSPLSAKDSRLINASNYQKGAVIQTREYRAPEIVIGSDFGPKTDIWSLACIAFELVTGDFLFDPKVHPAVSDENTMDQEHLAEMVQVIGPADPKWVLGCGGINASRFFTDAGELRVKSLGGEPRNVGLKQSLTSRISDPGDAAQIYSFLRAALCWSAEERPTAAECLQHPWLSS